MYKDNTVCIEGRNHIISGREHAQRFNMQKHLMHEVIHNGHMKLISVATVVRVLQNSAAAVLLQSQCSAAVLLLCCCCNTAAVLLQCCFCNS